MTDRETLIKLLCDKYDHFCDQCGVNKDMRYADNLADYLLANGVTVRSHGTWIEKPSGKYGAWQSWCSVCGKHSGIGGIESNRHKPYCPNCGARMKGAGDDAAD